MKTNWILYFYCTVAFMTTLSIEKSLAGGNETAPQADSDSTVSKGFFRKIGNYFKDSNEDKSHDKKFDFSVIGGPHYSSDVKLGLGLVAAGLFRTKNSSPEDPPSNIALTFDAATSGFYLIGIKGNTFFNQAKYRFDYSASFFSMPADFWGIGYAMGENDENQSEFKRQQTSIKTDFMYRFANNFYIGANLNFHYITGKNFQRQELLEGQNRTYTNFGPGIFLMYDSRDYVTAPHKGWFVKLESTFFPKQLGNKPHFYRSEITVNFYHKVWKGGVLAYDYHNQYNKGNVPWTMLARMGGSNRMRGYYEGRYRDKGIIEAQVELRQNVWRRVGFTVWGGAGNVYNNMSDFDFSHTLPNYGFGLRWEFKKRVNVRLDYGLGRGQSGFIFNINEAF